MKTCKGFTLVELMITLVIAAIVLTVGIPNFRSLIQNNRIVTQANSLVGALNLARSEAVSRGIYITLCPTTNKTSCVDSTNWATGWIMFADTDNLGTYNTGEEIIRVWDPLTGGSTLTGTFNIATFKPSGASATAEFTYTLRISDCTGDQGRNIVMSTMGRISTSKVACS